MTFHHLSFFVYQRADAAQLVGQGVAHAVFRKPYVAHNGMVEFTLSVSDFVNNATHIVITVLTTAIANIQQSSICQIMVAQQERIAPPHFLQQI